MHLIKEHSCRTLNFIGGPKENQENMARENGFRSALKGAGIEPDERRIQSWSWNYTDGIEAFNQSNIQSLLDADAFVCANDRLAAGFIFEAQHFGYHVPEDFLVTGFDNNSFASVIYPLLTTVDRDRIASGRKCCATLIKAIRKEEIHHFTRLEASTIFSQSCGCDYNDHEKNRAARNAQTESSLYKEALTADIYAMEKDLSSCNNAEEYYSKLYQYVSYLKCASFYMMINEGSFCNSISSDVQFRKEGYDEYSAIHLAIEDDVRVPEKEIMFPTRELIPFRPESSGHLYLISPLHFQDQCIGYCVSVDTLNLLEYNRHFDWLNAVNLTLNIVHEKRTLSILNDKLNLLYMKDAMTGLYNRFGYTMKAMDMFRENILSQDSTMVMFLDIDNLKMINDNFGHEHGDLAIRTVSAAICAEIPEDFIPVRYGGDEFVIIGKCNNFSIAESLRNKLIRHLDEYNEHSSNRYQVTASIGYTIAEPGNSKTLDDYVKLADATMYEGKKQFKLAQKNSH